jgi:hypothetical protein
MGKRYIWDKEIETVFSEMADERSLVSYLFIPMLLYLFGLLNDLSLLDRCI